mmetsp:Transcript_30523/g.97407  ORF Transcript_30523/g.97407 Transcript_30523/m.97407 type:complete len:208 (-) Transcript_30523:113-736(-)
MRTAVLLVILGAADGLRQPWRPMQAAGSMLRPAIIGATAGLQLLSGGIVPTQPMVANAADTRTVGEIAGSGFVFKDTLKIEAFDDPKIQGVSLYISDFSRPITDRLQKDFFSDPGSASITCAAEETPTISGKLDSSKGGEEIFSEAKSLLFKTLRVRRLYDPEAGNAIYVVYNTRLQSDDANKNRFKSSICAVHVGKPGEAEAAASK